MQTLVQALSSKVPVVFDRGQSGHSPLVVCEKGKEAEAFNLLIKLGVVERLTPSVVKAQQPPVEEILKYFGWTIECVSPYELKHPDGSFASGDAARRLVESLTNQWVEEHGLMN